MKTLPLTVLVYEGPMARAYLAAMHDVGLRPNCIIQMVLDHHPASRRPVPRWLPKNLRLKIATKIQESSLHFWTRKLKSDLPDLVAEMTRLIGRDLEVSGDVFNAVHGNEPLSKYCSDVRQILVSGYEDPILEQELSALGPGALLYTGGGIVPKNILSLPGLKVLHAHPGFLPDVKGSDGMLWSILARQKIGVSCFYMAPGIDTGHIILAREFDPISIPTKRDDRPDSIMLYRALFALYDPVFRAKVLQETLALGDDPAKLKASPQDGNIGITYHFMHPAIRDVALQKMFPEH